MKPYYFSGSAGMNASIWLYSEDFDPKVGLALSNTTAALSPPVPAWAYRSNFSSSAIYYQLPSSSLYLVESTSKTTVPPGTFKLYISQGETSSIVSGLNPPYTYGPSRIVLNKSTQLMFVHSLAVHIDPGSPFTLTPTGSYSYDQKLDVIDPVSNTILSTHYNGIGDRQILDIAYNSINHNMYVWTSRSGSSFMDIWNRSGSVLLSSHSVDMDFSSMMMDAGPYTTYFGSMAFNSDRNHILISPTDGFAVLPLSYSIYDCTSNTLIYTGSKNYQGSGTTYVPSTQRYYIASGGWYNSYGYAFNSDRINAVTYAITASSITSSYAILQYIPELNILLGDGGAYASKRGPVVVHDPVTENVIATIPGILDFSSPAAYDPCRSCLVIADDLSGDAVSYAGGGLCFIDGATYQPVNFISLNGAYLATYCDATSTIWASNYNNNNIIAIVPSRPTASFMPQPTYPSYFGEDFESYALGPISVLNVNATVFTGEGVVTQSYIGIVAVEDVNSYATGSAPALDAGIGWSGSGVIS